MMGAADSEDQHLFSLDEASGKLSLVGEVAVEAPGASISLIGVSDAGLYVGQSYDCGCTHPYARRLRSFAVRTLRPIPRRDGLRVPLGLPSVSYLDGRPIYEDELSSKRKEFEPQRIRRSSLPPVRASR